MNLVAELVGAFIVPDGTVHASVQIIKTGLRHTASLFTFSHGHTCFDCLKRSYETKF